MKLRILGLIAHLYLVHGLVENNHVVKDYKNVGLHESIDDNRDLIDGGGLRGRILLPPGKKTKKPTTSPTTASNLPTTSPTTSPLAGPGLDPPAPPPDDGGTPAPPPADLQTGEYISGGGKFKVSWAGDTTARTIAFKVVAETTGWVGLGILGANGGTFHNAKDCFVGWVTDGQATFMDCYSTEAGEGPSDDTINHYSLVSGSEENGITTFEFTRAIYTGDENDIPFTDGIMSFAWGLSPEDGSPAKEISKHTLKGKFQTTILTTGGYQLGEEPLPPPPQQNEPSPVPDPVPAPAPAPVPGNTPPTPDPGGVPDGNGNVNGNPGINPGDDAKPDEDGIPIAPIGIGLGVAAFVVGGAAVAVSRPKRNGDVRMGRNAINNNIPMAQAAPMSNVGPPPNGSGNNMMMANNDGYNNNNDNNNDMMMMMGGSTPKNQDKKEHKEQRKKSQTDKHSSSGSSEKDAAWWDKFTRNSSSSERPVSVFSKLRPISFISTKSEKKSKNKKQARPNSAASETSVLSENIEGLI